MRSAQVVSCALFVVVTLGQDATKNIDYLRGEDDAWSCDLQEKINKQCQAQEDSEDEVTRRYLAPRQSSKPDSSGLPGHTASACTCNNIYFNIWSACYLTNDNTHTLPSLREWEDACAKAGTPYDKDHPLSSNSRLEGLWIPPWAQIPVPSDTFDVMQAVVVAAPREWKMAHILAPIFSCLGTLLLVGILFCAVTRNRSKTTWFSKLRSLFPSRSAQYEAPRPDWVIDYNDETLSGRQGGRVAVEVSKSSLLLNGGDFHNHGDWKGHHQGHTDKVKDTPRKVLKKLKHTNASTTTLESNRPPPLDLTDAFSDTQRISAPLASKWSDSDSFGSAPRIQQARRIPGSATLHSLVGNVRIPNPFGTRPPAPQERFIDPYVQYDGRYRPQIASPQNYDTGFDGTIGKSKRSIRHPGQRQNLPGLTEERQSLISDEDRRSNNVFLISKAPGQDFAEAGSQGDRSDTMNSVPVNVESPTASSRESWRTKSQSFEQPARIPPAPRYPPPAPPSRSQSNATYPLADIPEDSEKPTSSSASSQNASEAQSPLSVGHIPTPFRGYAYAPDRYPTPDASPSALSQHQPLPSIDSYFEVGEHGAPKKMISPRQEEHQLSRQQTPRQQPVELQPSTSTSPPGRQTGPFIPNGYHQTVRPLPRLPGSPRPMRGRTLSSSSLTSSDGGARHWRRPSNEESSAGFYFSPSSPSIHMRTLSNDNMHCR